MGPALKYSLLGISLMWGMAVGGLWPQLIDIRNKTRTMADDHRKHRVAHPGVRLLQQLSLLLRPRLRITGAVH